MTSAYRPRVPNSAMSDNDLQRRVRIESAVDLGDHDRAPAWLLYLVDADAPRPAQEVARDIWYLTPKAVARGSGA